MAIALVTGGAGFIGSHLIRALIRRGFQVRVLDNFSTGSIDNLEEVKNQIELFDADIRKLESVQQGMKDVEVVFHQAALPSVPRSMKDPVTTMHVNVDGTLNVLEAAKKAGVRRVVFASSSSIYGESPERIRRETAKPMPVSPYALSKLMGEQLCALYTRCFGLETVALRYFNVFGAHQDPTSQYSAAIPKFVSALLNGHTAVIYGDGEQSRDFTFVENVVQANLLAAGVPGVAGKVFNVGCGSSVTVNALYDMLENFLDLEAPPRYEPSRPGDVRHSCADIALAAEHLGYIPGVDVENGLRSTVAWYQSAEGAARGPSSARPAVPVRR